jgi:hypothetical protein
MSSCEKKTLINVILTRIFTKIALISSMGLFSAPVSGITFEKVP